MSAYGRQSVFRFCFTVAAIILCSTSAAAQLPAPPPGVHPINQLLTEIAATKAKIEAITIRSAYCSPPYEPNKEPDQWEIDFLKARAKALRVEFNRLQRSYEQALRRSDRNYAGSFPAINGVTPDDPRVNYWAKIRQPLSEIDGMLATKEDQLHKAKLKNCAPETPKQPPTQPPSTPPTTPTPASRLTRPTPLPIVYPDPPKFFCSFEEKYKFSQDFRSTTAHNAGLNAMNAIAYDADVHQAVNDLANQGKGGEADALRKTEGRWASDNAEARVREQEEVLKWAKEHIDSIPIVDCNKPAEHGEVLKTQSTTQQHASAAGQWSVTVTGGFAFVTNPQTGQSFTIINGTSGNTFAGRPTLFDVSTWAVGDAALLVSNVVAALYPNQPSVRPLDGVLYGRNAKQNPGPDIGIETHYSMTADGRIGLGGSAYVLRSNVDFTDQTRDRIESTRSDLESAFSKLIGTNGTAGAIVHVTEPTRRAVYISTEAIFHLMARSQTPRAARAHTLESRSAVRQESLLAGWDPVVEIGGGVVLPTGESPTATLVTDYQFTSNGVPYHETDTSVITVKMRRALGLRVGGGISKPLTRRMDLVINAGVFLSQNRFEVNFGATPTKVVGTPASATAFASIPSIQFSTLTQGPKSSLGAPLSATTFKGSGVQMTTSVTTGVRVRF